MILFNIGVLPYDHNIAFSALKQVAHKNALKQENKIILFKYRKANKNIQSERDRIRDQIGSYSILKLNIMMILVKFDRIPIMKDQIKILLLPLIKVKEQIIIMVDQFHTSEDREQDYVDIQSLIHYFKLKVFIVYLDKNQFRNDIFTSLKDFDYNLILQLSINQDEDLFTMQNITKQLTNIHQKIITKNLNKSNKKSNKWNKQTKQNIKNKKKYKIEDEIQPQSTQREEQLKTQSQDEYMKAEITDFQYNSINQNIQPHQYTYILNIEDDQNQPQLIYENEKDQFKSQQNHQINNNQNKKDKSWCYLI